MVRSNLEYCSSLWAPHTKKLKDKLENVQKEQHVMSHIAIAILVVYLICYIVLIGLHYTTEEIHVNYQCYMKIHTI